MVENLVAKSHQLNPTVWIGKNGLDDKLFDEIKKQLKNKKLIKVKILKGAVEEHDLDRKKIPSMIAEKVKAEIVQKVGYVFSLYKR